MPGSVQGGAQAHSAIETAKLGCICHWEGRKAAFTTSALRGELWVASWEGGPFEPGTVAGTGDTGNGGREATEAAAKAVAARRLASRAMRSPSTQAWRAGWS